MDLGVGASSDAVKSIVGRLGGLLAQQYTLIRGVRDDIRYINDEMASMQAFLTTVERAGHHDEQRRVWMKQVRDMVYDIEDINHRLGPEPRGNGRLMFLQRAWYMLTTLNTRRCVASEIRNLKIWAQDISNRRMRYGMENPRSTVTDGGSEPEDAEDPIDRVGPPPELIGTQKPVGLEDAMVKLGELFEVGKQSTQKRFLAIVGIGGLGKTTLATEFYRKVGDNFDCRAFVQVSQKFNLLPVLRSLVKQFHEHQAGSSLSDSLDGIEDWGEKDFRKKLGDQLKDKRYLVLIDDIWSVSAWEKINDCLPESMRGCTILVTTRFKSVVAACCRRNGHSYEQKPLTEETSYKLLRQIISEASHHPTVAARDLIDKCRGLPLVIIVIAGLVASKLRSGPSSSTLDRHLSAVANALRGISGTNLTIQILNHCYNDLSADLKTCLLYLSMFPKSCVISRKRLIRRWISEGFIVEKYGLSAEEVAEDCFNELISRKLIFPINNTSTGKVKYCQINDMLLEYIVCKSSDENFITVVGGHWQTIAPDVLAAMYRVRCLSVHGSAPEDQEILERMDLSHVRSFTAFERFKAPTSCLAKFQVLQVLDLECCRDLSPKQLKNVWKMRLLTYLSLRGTSIRTVPSEIENLEYLEVLDIRETEVKILPPSVKRLKRMAHLLTGDKSRRIALTLTEEVTEMTALQTLSGVGIRGNSSAAEAKMASGGSRGSSCEALEALQSLTNLKKLSIYILGKLEETDKDSLLSAIEHLSCCSLKFLTINDDFTGFVDNSLSFSKAPPELLYTLKLSGMLSKVPSWIVSLHSLEKLNLSLTSLSTNTLVILSELPELFSLIFSLDAINANDPSIVRILHKNILDSEGEIFVQSRGFGKLKLLRFLAPMLPPLSFMDGAMPALERLELRFRFADGVHGVENLASLKQVFLTISSKATKGAKEIKRLADKIQKNPPTVIIDEYNESSMEQ